MYLSKCFSLPTISDPSSTSDFQLTNSRDEKIHTLLAVLTSPLKLIFLSYTKPRLSTLRLFYQSRKSDNQASKEIKNEGETKLVLNYVCREYVCFRSCNFIFVNPLLQILEWMHQKFRHNSIKPFKDLNIGIPAVCFFVHFLNNPEGVLH